jgi:2-haloacid dehalogenase
VTVRAVVFDVGGVIYDWHPRYLFERMTDDTAFVDRVVGEAVTHQWHFQHDAGRDFADTSAELIARFPEYERFIRAYGPRFNETIRGAIPGVLEIVRELDACGVPLFAITNFSHEFFPPFAAQHAEIFDRFRDIVVSGEEKRVKPHPEIYRRALARFGLAPGEGLFVDDREENAKASDAAGFVGHHFSDAATLRTELNARGLL